MTGNIRAARPGKTAAYERHVATCAQLAANLAKWAPLDEPCAITLRIYRAAMRGDWDNYSKAVQDGMNGIAFTDDRHIVAADVAMFVDRVNPRVEVRVERATEPTAREGG